MPPPLLLSALQDIGRLETNAEAVMQHQAIQMDAMFHNIKNINNAKKKKREMRHNILVSYV